MFKFLKHIFKRKKHKLPHREDHIGHNWFYHKSIPDPNHPEFLEQAQLCYEVIRDLEKYGLLETHHRTWQISRDIHIPSLRYYLCATHPEYKFRVHSKKYLFGEKMDVTIYVEHAKESAAKTKMSEVVLKLYQQEDGIKQNKRLVDMFKRTLIK